MNSHPNIFGTKFGLIWTLANVLGLASGYVIGMPAFNYAQANGLTGGPIVMGLAVGAAIGLAQGVVVFRRISEGWILATSIGFAIGFTVAGSLTAQLNSMTWSGWAMMGTLTGVSVGLCTGAAQGIVLGLRSTLVQWTVVNAVGYALGYGLGHSLPASVPPDVRVLNVYVIGLTVGVVSWLALRRTTPTVA